MSAAEILLIYLQPESVDCHMLLEVAMEMYDLTDWEVIHEVQLETRVNSPTTACLSPHSFRERFVLNTCSWGCPS